MDAQIDLEKPKWELRLCPYCEKQGIRHTKMVDVQFEWAASWSKP